MHVGKLDESFYDFIENVHPPTDNKKLLTSNPRSKLYEGWPWSIDWTYMYAFFKFLWIFLVSQ